MLIPHIQKESEFSKLLKDGLRVLEVERKVVVNLNKAGGYRGKIEISIRNTNEGAFKTNFDNEDSSRFPARIKAVASELRNQGILGSFLVSHEEGMIEVERIEKSPSFYWVNLGDSHKEVLENNFLWAPSHTLNKKGEVRISAGWKSVPNIKQGDIIFCHHDKRVIFVAIANKDAYPSKRPESRKYERWKEDGYKVEVSLEVLNPPIPRDLFKDEFVDLFNNDCKPKLFDRNRKLAEQYMISLPASGGSMIMDALGEQAIEIQETIYETKDDEKKPEGSVREAIVKARIGQEKFRRDLLKLWSDECPITGVNAPELLVASHIVPWNLSNSSEKVDPYNGLPLSPNLDKLFDRGDISFSDAGKIIIKDTFDKTLLDKLGINIESSITGLTDRHRAYLARHRELKKIVSLSD